MAPEHVDLAVLLKNLTGSAELVKVRQTLCRVGDSSNIPNGILLDVQVKQIIQQIRHGHRLLIYKATSRRKWC
jgi:hypothetical protein